jgi:hypothetical protein
VGNLSSYPANVKKLCLGLKSTDAELSDTLVKYRNFLVKNVNKYCMKQRMEQEDMLQQLLIRLLKYSKDYKTIGVCKWNGESFKITEDFGSICRLLKRGSEETVIVRKELLDITKKISYTNFIRLKIKQELSNIRKYQASKKKGYGAPHVSLFGEEEDGEGLIQVLHATSECCPDKIFSRKEEKEQVRSLSRFARRFYDGVEMDGTLSEGKLVKELRMNKRRLRFAKREVKNGVFGAYAGLKAKPIHVSAGNIRW